MTLRNIPLAGRLLLLAVVPLGIMLASTLALTVNSLNQLEADTSVAQLQQEQQIIGQQFLELEASLRINGAKLAIEPALLDAIQRNDQTGVQSILLATLIQTPEFSHIQILDAEGRLLGIRGNFETSDLPPELDRLNQLGLLQVEAAELAPTAQGWLLAVVQPLKLSSGQVAGVLSVGKLLDGPALFALNFKRSDSHLALYDAQGNLSAVSAEAEHPSTDVLEVDRALWLQASQGQAALGQTTIGGERHRVLYAPLAIGGGPSAVFSLDYSTAATNSSRDQLVATSLIVMSGLMVLVVIAIVAFGRDSIARPIAAVSTGAKRLMAGQLDVVVPGAESRDEIGVLAATFNNMTARLRESISTLEARTAQLNVGAEVSRTITSVLDPDDLIQQVARLITDRFKFYYTAVFLLDESGKFAVLREATGVAGKVLKESGHHLEIGGQSMVSAAITEQKPRVTGHVAAEPMHFANPLLPDTASEVALPLAVGDRVLGALDVQSTRPDAFDASTLSVLQSLADQIAIALNNARQFQSAQLDARQATALFEASRLAGFISEDLATAAEQLLETVTQQADFDAWVAVMFDAETSTYRLLATHLGSQAAGRADPARPVDAPTALAIRLRQSITINEPEIDPLLNDLPAQERSVYGRSVSAPAMIGDRVVGAVSLRRSLDKPAIDPRNIQLAQAVANQLAVTIENRRLFEQARRAVVDLEELMRLYTREGWTKFAQARPNTIEHEFSQPGAPPLNPGVLPEFYQTAQPERSTVVRFDGQAAVAIPIALRGEVIGVLGAQDEAGRRWSEDELVMLKAVADQVAQSIEVARLLDETESNLHEATDLYQASRAVAAAATPAEVMQIIVKAIQHRLEVDQVSLALFDEEKGYGTVEAEAAPTPGQALARLPMAGDPSYEMVAQTRRPLTVYAEGGDPATAAVAEMLQQRGIASALLLPLIVGQRLIGSIRADASSAARRFSEKELAFCETLARQAAAAIENRRLFEETQRRVEIESALNRISQTIRASLDPQSVLDLQATIAAMGQVIRASRSFYLANEDDQRFRCTYEWCAPEVVSWRGSGESWSDMPTALQQLKSGQSLVVEQVEQADRSELWPLARRRGALAYVYVPVLTGNRLIGILGFEQVDRERRWTPEEVSMVQRVADQLAAALENARLYQDVRSRVNELTALTRIGRRLTATLQLEEVLNTIVEEALNVTPADRGSISLYDAPQDTLELRVMIGYSQETMERMRTNNALRQRDGLHGRLLETGQAVLSHDLQQDGIYQPVKTDTRAGLIVPIKQGNTLLGALNLESPRAHAFSEADQRLIEALADQAAVAMVNARAYEAERTALGRMREVDRLKTQFLANMSHELRTPLNSIIGFSRVILRGIDGPLTELQQADLTAIHNSGQHLLGLINDILDLSKIEAGKMELSKEDVDLADIIKGVMSTAIALVKDKSVELRQEVPADLPPVKADSRRIRQVVLNLVSNAAKFTDKGYILARVTGNAREVRIAVSDTGMGIPPDKLDHIFEEFTQVDASTTRKVGGTGLGLAISRHFVEMHGGRMWVESEMNAGSVFSFTLPVEQPVEPAQDEPPDEAAAPEPGKKCILCIEDDPGVITLYRRYLEKQGYQVIGLSDSTKAVQEAQRLRPAAITLDVLMPNRDGWSVLADLKSVSETSSIPIVVCSILEDQSKGFALGAADYLIKPISENELLRALERVNGSRPVRSVLVIDDEPEATRLLRRMLEARPGLRVIEALGGAQGIVNVQTHQPDVVILDLMMPDIDGFAVLETIKSNRLSRNIPVIIVTAKELTEEDRVRLQGKTVALLNKGGFDSERLLQEIIAVLERINSAVQANGIGANSLERPPVVLKALSD
ncbi:MAG TPA: GAF domain-containing protein [Anaerolineae bacterium]|nr:GAF domain-containing protein [Anaerolineae bacterium]